MEQDALVHSGFSENCVGVLVICVLVLVFTVSLYFFLLRVFILLC